MELSEQIKDLTPAQARAISTIVDVAEHLVESPPAPYVLLRRYGREDGEGIWSEDDGIAAESTWKRWTNDAAFMQALNYAKRLYREYRTQEDLAYRLAQRRAAKRAAQSRAERMVGVWHEIAEDDDQPAKDRNDAAKHSLDFAFDEGDGGGGQPGQAEDAAADWWQAAFDE